MTNKEAIEVIQSVRKQYIPRTVFDEANEALDFAIKALEDSVVNENLTGDLISRSALIKASCNIELTADEAYHCTIGREKVLDLIQNAPTVELRDVFNEGYFEGKRVARPTGKWMEKGIGLGARYYCSNCGHIMDKVVAAGGNIIDAWSNYCPNCGANMKEGDSND